MFQRSRMLVPIVRSCSKINSTPVLSQSRNIWDWPTSRDMRSLFRNMDREFERMERDFFRNSPLRILAPRFMPIEGKEMASDSYRVNIDVHGFKPEDIKMALKDGILKIEAKMDRTAEDGSRIQQAIVREFTLPESVDTSSIKSFLHDDGILSIEAALHKVEQKPPKEIPIEQSESNKALPKSKM